MTPATAPRTAEPPDDPLRTEMDSPACRPTLEGQARAMLNRFLADFPPDRRAQEIEDIVSQTFAMALEKQAEYDRSRPAGAWLHGFLVRIVYQRCRELRKLPQQPPDHTHGWDVLDRANPESDDERQELTRLLDRLNPDDRKMVEWYAFEGLSHREIGARLKITEGTSRIRVHRVLKQLKREADTTRMEGDR